TEEPIDFLNMGDEHLDTIPATKSDEVINSSVEDLVPILNESEGIPEHKCNVPFHDNSPPLDVSKDQIKDFSEFNNEVSSIDDDSFFVGGIDDDIVLTIKDDILCEKLLNVNFLITKIEAFNDNPTPSFDCKNKSSSTSLNSLLEETNTFHNSLLEFENFYFDLGEISSGSTTTHSDISLSEYDSFIFDLTHEEFVDELAHIISPPEYDCFYFRDLPDPGELMSVLNFGIRKNLSTTSVNLPIEDDHSPLLEYVVWIFVAYLTQVWGNWVKHSDLKLALRGSIPGNLKTLAKEFYPLREISSGSSTTHSDISLPDYEAFYFDDDHIKEISSGSTTTHSDISLSEYDSFIFAHEEFVDELTHIISLPEYDCFYFRDLPDQGELMSVLNSGIRENLSTTLVNLPIEDDYSPPLAYVVWIFVAYLTYSVIPPYLHPFGNEDTIFDPCITINHVYSFKPVSSHWHGAFKKFTTHRSYLNEWPMIINGKNTPILDFPPTNRSDLTHKEFCDEPAHIISPSKYDGFYLRNLPDLGELMSILNSRIRKNLSSTTCVNLPVEDDYSPLLAYVVKENQEKDKIGTKPDKKREAVERARSGMKVIKREFSVARTPQQNGIAERKNRTLIEAARTMLADPLLPILFWAEAVNTACYVQNRVLVTKPHNKIPYELLLGKFDGKADEGFLVGYSVNSKAFRVFNSRTRIVQETLHINFLENQPNVAASGPTWIFNIDTLTKSMNYQPVSAENQPNSSACIQQHFDADKVGEGNGQQYVLFPLWSIGSKDPQNTDVDTTFEVKEPESEVHVSPSSSTKIKKHDDKTKREAKGKTCGKSSYVDPSHYPDDPDMPALEDITYSNDEEDVGAEADFSNLETNINVSTIPTTRVHKDHPVTKIISDLSSAPQTRSMTRMVKEQGGLTQINNDDFYTCMFACFLSQEEPKRIHQALKDPSWIEAIQEELLQFKMQKVWVLVDLLKDYASFMGFMVYQIDVKSAFLYETIKEEVYVCQPPGFEDPDYPDKVYKVVKALYDCIKLLELGMRHWLIIFWRMVFKRERLARPCSSRSKKKFGLTNRKSASTPIDTEKPLLKDPDGEDVDAHTYRSMIDSLMYLTSSRPDIMFAVCAYAHF
nr:hypothetical protein [Tanacetum cinerariifolium]